MYLYQLFSMNWNQLHPTEWLKIVIGIASKVRTLATPVAETEKDRSKNIQSKREWRKQTLCPIAIDLYCDIGVCHLMKTWAA